MESATKQPDYASPEYAAKVESDLRGLQDTHQLAIHQWENYIERDTFAFLPWTYPKWTLQWLQTPPDEISARLKNGTMPLLSVSPLPGTGTGVSIEPAYCNRNLIPLPGYCFDLSQQDDQSARVVRASVLDLDTGYDPRTKELRLMKTGGLPAELKSYYTQFPSKQALLDHVASGHYNAEQLDPTGRFYEQSEFNKEFYTKNGKPEKILKGGELAIAASQSHIQAISVPVYADDKADPAYLPLVHLTAALAGLQHLDRQIDLPVVIYHVNGPEKNQHSYFGQGREMLTEKAVEAVMQIKYSGILKPISNPATLEARLLEQRQRRLGLTPEQKTMLHAAIMNTLGMDMTKLLNEPLTPPETRSLGQADHVGQGLYIGERGAGVSL